MEKSRSSPPSTPPPAQGAPERLESWKEIAAYLNRDARTVQRWERTRGLPVHRLPGGKLPRIYALRSELDAWWNSRGIHVAQEEEAEHAPAVRTSGRRRLAWAAGVAGALLVATLAYWRWSGTGPQRPLRVTPLTSLPGFVRSPFFSPDGKQVVFSWNGASPDNFDLYIKDLAAGEPRRLTTDPTDEGYPAWSPDGHHIAFLRWRLGQPVVQLCVVPQAGGTGRVLDNSPVPELDPVPIVSWTPDSRFLIDGIPDVSGPMALFLISVETGERRRLTQPSPTSAGDDSAVLSPDGKKVAFVRRLGPGGGNASVLDLNPDYSPRGQPRQLTHELCCVSNPIWTGDGKEILYVKQEDATSTIYRVPAAGGGRPRPVSGIGPAAPYLTTSQSSIASGSAQLAISAQGDKLVYVGGSLESGLWRVDLAGRRPDGELPAARWLSSSRVDSRPQISPDGQKVAFVSSRGGNLEIWVAEADGSNALQVTSLRGPEAHAPRWSPDSREIVFHANVDGAQDLYVTSAAGGSPRRLTRGPGNNMWASWSHDGKWIYFASNRTGQYQCWRMPAAGGEAVQITKGGGYGGFESADGRFLYYPKHYMTGDIWRTPVGGGEEALVDKSVMTLRGPANYVVAREGIYTASSENLHRGFRLQLYRFATGKVEVLGHIGLPLGRGGMSISSDGRWLLFTDNALQRGDLMLVENFR